MFTLQQIQEAHSQVKSGADFPAYIQALKKLGILSYQTFVADGHTDFYGAADFKISSAAKYDALTIATQANATQFTSDLKAHQQGKTNYPTFCANCAKSGVEKWEVNLQEMTCTYFDKAITKVLVEQIPLPL